jgi:flagellin
VSRIGATISGFEMRLLQSLRASETAAALHGFRLATGRKINDPRDDPSGFVNVVRIENQLSQVQQASANVSAASSIASQAQLALDQIRTQLGAIRTLLLEDEDQSLTASERSANQAQIDEALAAITALAASPIDGRRRLDGSLDYGTTGLDWQQVESLRVLAPGAGTITGRVVSPATRATLTYTGAAGLVMADATITLAGKRGSAVITVAQNDDLDAVAATVNGQSHATGVTAEVDGDDLVFTSVDYGTAARLEVSVLSGAFAVTGGDGSGLDVGADASVIINGAIVSSGGSLSSVDGNRVHFVSDNARFELVLRAGFAGTLESIEVHDDSIGRFALSADLARTSVLAIPGVLPGHFRGASGSLLDLGAGGEASGLGANTSRAVRIVDESLARLTVVEGQVDAFADHAVGASAEFLASLEANLQDALENVNLVDEDEENLLVARSEALASNALSSLAILQEQRSRVVGLLEQIAGF